MTNFFRPLAGFAVPALFIALGACKPLDQETGDPLDGSGQQTDAAAGASGLETQEQRAGYVVGLQLGKTIEPIEDEIDRDAVGDGIDATLDGKDPLLSQEQMMQVMQELSTRVQKKQQEEAQRAAAEEEAFLEQNGKKSGVKTTESGLQYQVLEEGSGERPTAEDKVRVHYEGKLLDGSVFDSSLERGEPVVFTVGQVVPGWQEGLQLMRPGGKYRLWVPSVLGYGEQGEPNGSIGPNATLIFEVELLEIVADEQ